MKKLLIPKGIALFAVPVLMMAVVSSCKKETMALKTEQILPAGETVKPTPVEADGKSLPIGATASAVSIHYLNLIGSGYSTVSTYFSVDFNGDGKTDVLERRANGNLYLHLGNSTASFPTGQYPDKVGDNLSGVTYTLSAPVVIGSGFNFSRYFLADYNGDNKCDILGQNADGNMWIYYSNGSGLSSGEQQIRFGQAPAWSLTSKFVPADKNGDKNYELIEIGDFGSSGSFQQSWSRGSGSSHTWTSYGSSYYTTKVFDKNDEYFPINIDGDVDVDFFIRKANGNLYYSKCGGLSSSFTTPIQCGTGWNSFTDVYGSYHWNCWTANASLTGRQPNGNFYMYKWNSATNSFSSGSLVGTGWNFTKIMTGNYIPDVSVRQDFIGLNPDGNMHAYCTLVSLN